MGLFSPLFPGISKSKHIGKHGNSKELNVQSRFAGRNINRISAFDMPLGSFTAECLNYLRIVKTARGGIVDDVFIPIFSASSSSGGAGLNKLQNCRNDLHCSGIFIKR